AVEITFVSGKLHRFLAIEAMRAFIVGYRVFVPKGEMVVPANLLDTLPCDHSRRPKMIQVELAPSPLGQNTVSAEQKTIAIDVIFNPKPWSFLRWLCC